MCRLLILIALVFAPSSLLANEDASSTPQELVDGLMREVEELRGLKFKRPVPVVSVDPGKVMSSTGATSGMAPPREAMEAMLVSSVVGLFPRQMAESMVGQSGELRLQLPGMGSPPGGPKGPPPGAPPGATPGGAGIGGPGMGGPGGGMGGVYQDRGGKRIVLFSPPGAKLSRRILTHELTHALDDQHHDLSRFRESMIGSDRALALQAIVEGSAVSVELDWVVRSRSDGKMASAADDPSFPPFGGYLPPDGTFRAPPGVGGGVPGGAGGMPPGATMMVFPYAYGFEFVAALRKRGIARSEMFTRPPLSTEQIMHPEKWLAEDPDSPVRVVLSGLESALHAGGSKTIGQATIGEFGILSLLRAAKVEDAEASAAGWDGDSAIVTFGNGKLGLVWLTEWDSEADAREFETAAPAYLERVLGVDFEIARERVIRVGTSVVVVTGSASRMTAALRKSLDVAGGLTCTEDQWQPRAACLPPELSASGGFRSSHLGVEIEPLPSGWRLDTDGHWGPDVPVRFLTGTGETVVLTRLADGDQPLTPLFMKHTKSVRSIASTWKAPTTSGLRIEFETRGSLVSQWLYRSSSAAVLASIEVPTDRPWSAVEKRVAELKRLLSIE